jgi:uncharacterized protein YcfL/curli biogenesis system outer membrane secretion channel CsgG
MKTELFARLLAVGALGVAAAAPAQLAQGEKDTIFIGELRVKPSIAQKAAQQGQSVLLARAKEALEGQFHNAISVTRVFQIVERQRVEELKLEQAFATAEVNPEDKNAARQLKMAGAKFAFLPEVTAFEDRTATATMAMTGAKDVGHTLFIAATVRVVDTTKGTYLPDAPSEQITSTQNIINTDEASVAVAQEQMVMEATKRLSRMLSIRVTELLRPAKVLAVTGRQVLINRGAELGFEPGAVVALFATQEVKDDDTGEIFFNETPLGNGRVDRADARQSYAILGGDNPGVVKGCVVKLVGFAPGQPATVPALLAPFAAPAAATDAPPVPAVEAAPQVPAPAPVAGGEPPMNPGSSEKPLSWQGNTAPLPSDPNAAFNVRFTTQKLQKSITVVRVDHGQVDNLLKVSATLFSRSKLDARYKFVWFAAQGMEVEPGKAPWKTVFFAGNQEASVQGVAPNDSVRTYQLVIEPVSD